MILAIDPGPERSAWLTYDEKQKGVGWPEFDPNRNLLRQLRNCISANFINKLVIEMVSSYGARVGRDVFETCVWIGRFLEAFNGPNELLYRKKIASTLCGTATANDAAIRAALIEYFGGKRAAIGAIKCPWCRGRGWYGRGRPVCERCNGKKWEVPPGPLHGITRDCWSALAVAVAWSELNSAG